MSIDETPPVSPYEAPPPPLPPATSADVTPHAVVQAGFLRRWAALFLDSLILTCAFYAVFIVAVVLLGMLGGMGALAGFDAEDPPAWFAAAYIGVYVLYYLMAGIYYATMESSSHQATVGKMALGIKVVDGNGARLSFGHALGRWFAALLSYLTVFIGFSMAGFTERKQALHDFIVGTYVVDKWAYTDTPERQQHGTSGCLIAFFIGIVLLVGISVVGILAAIAIPAYQEYVVRARAVSAVAAAAPVKMQVMEYWIANGACPTNASEGFKPPAAYADTNVARMVIGPVQDYDDGGCGVVVWMPPPSGSTQERSITLEYLAEQQTWHCSSEMADKELPTDCRLH